MAYEIFDILKTKRTELAGVAKNIVQIFLKNPDKDPQDQWQSDSTSDESAPVEAWQHYGFASRPPADTENLIIRFGQNVFAVASRYLKALDAIGKLAEGDVALYTSGGNVIRLNTDGSITALMPDGGKQWVISLQPGPKGGLRVVSPGSMAVEMSDKNGITLNSADKPITLASTDKIQIIGAQVIVQGGAIKLGAKGAVPLVGTGALTPGAPNVFI